MRALYALRVASTDRRPTATRPQFPFTIVNSFNQPERGQHARCVVFEERASPRRARCRRTAYATPGAGEVRVKLATSGVNPSDVKSRIGRPLGTERIVPHSDGAGTIDAVGDGVPSTRVGQRVWLWNGQWQRPMGTAAEYIVLPEHR